MDQNYLSSTKHLNRDLRNISDLSTGAALTNSNSMNVLEFEIPFYSTRRFAIADSSQTMQGSARFDDPNNEKFSITVEGMAERDGFPEPTYVRTYVATGEDFNFLYYLGPEQYYVLDEVPQ